MKAGDARSTRILFFVAVAAIAFGVIEAIPSGAREREADVIRPAERTAVSAPATAPLEVSNDAFSSPILARRERIDTRPSLTGGMRAVEPFIPQIGGMLPGSAAVSPPGEVTGKPASPVNAETTRQMERAPKRTILLTGIVTVGDPVALIAVDGKDSRTFRIGEQLGPGIKLLAVEDRRAVIGFEHQRKVIYLGQVTEL